jgi:hypothetical protein
MRIVLIAAAAFAVFTLPCFAQNASPAQRPGIAATTGDAGPLTPADSDAWPTCRVGDSPFAKLKCSSKIFD